MSNWAKNKKLAIYMPEGKLLTDQSAARGTDINVIVGSYLTTGHAPGTTKEPLHGDFTEFPKDLREALDTARSTQKLREMLPHQLRRMPLDELLALTPDRIQSILNPPPEPEKPLTRKEIEGMLASKQGLTPAEKETK